MEPTSQAIRAVALAGLFRNVVDCFEYTRLGRDVSKHGRPSANWIELGRARDRLSQWGETVGLINGEVTNVQFLDQTAGNVVSAESLLGQIVELFADFEGVSDESNNVAVAGGSSLMVLSAKLDLYERMRNLSVKRQHGPALKQKAKWALYEKKHFERLVGGVAELVDALVERFPASQRHVSAAEDSEIETNATVPILEDSAVAQGHNLEAAISVGLESQDHNLRLRGGNRDGDPDGDDGGRYELIGEVYVHGIMDGMGIMRALANMHKMMQADPNHDFDHVHKKLETETKGTQFFMKMFVVV